MTRTALVVEDEADTGELLGEILRRRDFEPALLLEGQAALAWAREHRPGLILLDLMLPDIDGFTVCAGLKGGRDTNLIPVIMATARDQHEDRVRGLRAGADFYLVKPFTVDALLGAVDLVLARRDDLMRHGREGAVHFRRGNEVGPLEELNRLLGALLLFTGLAEGVCRQLTRALDELGSGACASSPLTLSYRIEPGRLTLVARGDPAGRGRVAALAARGLADDLREDAAAGEVRVVKHLRPDV
jgi:CheY-like chemotaxis protein